VTVLGATKIVDHGPDLDHFVVVIAGEGFTAAEQPDFVAAADTLLADFQATAPYSDSAVWNSLNFYRLDVTSPESGADNPLTCPDDVAGYVHTPPEVANTEYDAAYCLLDPLTGKGYRRLLELVSEGDLLTDVDLFVGAWDAVICAVNHQEYGGSGGNVAVFSMHPLSTQIAIHEFGHVLDLADEYDFSTDEDEDTYSGSEPAEPNVTVDSTGSKWSSFITAANLPTWLNPDCTVSNEPDPDPEPGAVGAYAGARYCRCGIYRPSHDCMMRHLGQPFCAVCEDHVRQRLSAGLYFNPDAPGCFIATAVYGDPHHRDVETIRSWRDRHLRPGDAWRGPMTGLAAVYRMAGPPVARAVRRHPALAGAIRHRVLEPLAAALRHRRDGGSHL
jgi:hypothetical protein